MGLILNSSSLDHKFSTHSEQRFAFIVGLHPASTPLGKPTASTRSTRRMNSSGQSEQACETQALYELSLGLLLLPCGDSVDG
jgi:hypothetical protein